MNILFYSSNASTFSGDDFDLYTFPSRVQVWKDLKTLYPQHRFMVATSLPGFFLTDVKGNKMEVSSPSDSSDVELHEITGKNAEEIAGELIALKPDLAIAASFWVPPYDWLGLQDSLVAEELERAGIKTLCHSSLTSLDCFDKNRTHKLLSSLGFKVPRAVYVHHELYWCERRHKELKTNVYKDMVLQQIKNLHYPVVIKDTVGLSSYSMEVAVSYKQALLYLNSGRTTCDRLVEEYIEGDQFGLEIYGSKGNYTVLPPFAFSLNRYGITSPKQSVKLGPMQSQNLHWDELEEKMIKLAQSLNLSPCAQIDLIYKEGEWYIIEINPRLSGMSETYAASLGKSLPQMLVEVALGEGQNHALRPALNFKLPILSEKQLEEVKNFPGVAYVHQIHNKAAKQEREKGYCEVVLTAAPTTGENGGDSASAPTTGEISSLLENLESFALRFSDVMEEIFLNNARNLALRFFSDKNPFIKNSCSGKKMTL